MGGNFAVGLAAAVDFQSLEAARAVHGLAAVVGSHNWGLRLVFEAGERTNLVVNVVGTEMTIAHKEDQRLLLVGEVGSGAGNHAETALEEAGMSSRNLGVVVRMAVRREQKFVDYRWENRSGQWLVLGGRSFADARKERGLEVGRKGLTERMVWASVAGDVD